MGDEVAKDGGHTGAHRCYHEDGAHHEVHTRGGRSKSHEVSALTDAAPREPSKTATPSSPEREADSRQACLYPAPWH